MRIDKLAVGDLDVLSLSGEFDGRSAQKFDDALDALITDFHTRIVVDLSGLQFMDSAGLTRLIAAQRRLRPLGGEEVLAGPTMIVQTTIKTAGIDRLVRIFPDVEEARKYFEDPERAESVDLEDVPVDESHIGRIEIEFGIADTPGESGTGKVLTTYEDGLLVRYPIDATRAPFDEAQLDVGTRLWLRFRQPAVAPDHEFAMEAEVLVATEGEGASKYRLKFTKIEERDKELMRQLAGTQDAIRKYGKPHEG